MNKVLFRSVFGAMTLATGLSGLARSEEIGRGQAVVTVLPAHGKEAAPLNLSQQDLAIKLNGKNSSIVSWTPLQGQNDRLELVVLIDGAARTSLSMQLGDIAAFVNNLPPTAKVAVAYMQNGRAILSGRLTQDHAQAAKELHIPSGIPGVNASPYFCLSDLAKNWPSNDRGARREVVMITDGVDYYNLRYDPEDPYVQAAINDSVRSGLVVYSIYWQNTGRVDRTMYETNAGQNLLLQVTDATGGTSYWQGYGNPVSFESYFKDIQRRLQNQYELNFTAPLKGKPEVQSMKLKVNGIAGKIDAPQQVFVDRSGV